MDKAIKDITSQFSFNPIIENESKIKSAESLVLCGMGGSHLAAGILKIYNPTLDIYIHRDYGLPLLSEKRFRDSLFVASSYSGNTEETLDFAEQAFAARYNLAIISTGGKLIEFAKENRLPYIQIPNTGIQPRNALGLSIIALSKLIGVDEALAEIQKLGSQLDPKSFESAGQKIAEELKGKVPVIYSSRSNLAVAYNWKIKFNETAKIPAFYNVLPELNHNEMTGFDVVDATKNLSAGFHFIFLEDSDDSPKIMRRMLVLRKLYEDRGLPVKVVELKGKTIFEKIFNSLILADWVALSLSGIYGTEPDQVPMVEEFKKLIA